MKTMGAFLPLSTSFRQFFIERTVKIIYLTTRMHPLFSLLALKLEQLTSKIYTTNYIKICDVFKKQYLRLIKK